MADLAATNGTDRAGMPWIICESPPLPSANIANRAFAGEAFQKGLLLGFGMVPAPEISKKFSDRQGYRVAHDHWRSEKFL